jgi:hypothetical protein
MPDLFKKLFGSSSKTKSSTLANATLSTTPGASKSHTRGDSSVNLNLIASPIVESHHVGPQNERKQRCISYGITALELLKEISEANDILAPLKAVCGVTLAILNTIEVGILSRLLLWHTDRCIQAMDRNKEAWREVLDMIHKHRSVFEQQLSLTNSGQIRLDLDPRLFASIQFYAR